MRILHIVGSLDQRSGGPLRAVLDLSAGARRLELESEVLGFGPVNAPDNPLPAQWIHSLPCCGPPSYGYSPPLRQWLQRNLGRFDAAMLHGMWSYANWAAAGACAGAGVPYIQFPHGMLDLWSVRGQGFWKKLKKSLYWNLFERRVLAGSQAVFFTTVRELQNARKTFGLPAIHPLIVRPHGMRCADGGGEMQPSAAVFQPAGRKVALFLGRVHPKKRPDLLIRAWQRAQLPPDWRLVMAGPGEPAYLSYLNDLAAECGVSGAVQFTGPVAGADKQYLFRRAAWFLLPSEQENFGIAVLEAVMSGCAVAISDQVYLADEFPEGAEILPVDVDVWAHFLRERMTDDSRRIRLVHQTTAKLAPIFDFEKIVRGWVAAIQSVTQGAPYASVR